jgi:hypothetical protein
MRDNHNVGGGPSGGGVGENKSPKERYDLFFLSISTQPIVLGYTMIIELNNSHTYNKRYEKNLQKYNKTGTTRPLWQVHHLLIFWSCQKIG